MLAGMSEAELRDRAMRAVAAAAGEVAGDPTRPTFHFLPPAQWMNDTHGAFYLNGHYHVFYQFQPWHDMSGPDQTAEGIGWGHARSPDLVRWEFLPPALLPLADQGERGLASGSACIRVDGVPMLFYTRTPFGTPENKREAWGALPADDELLTWRRVDLGLRAGQSGVPADIRFNWADMYVFAVGGRTFAIFKEANGLVVEARDEALTQWQAVSFLGGGHVIGDHTPTSPAVAGECPNVFSIAGSQVLIRSTYPISYLIGAFDADAITFESGSGPHVLDYGYGGAGYDDPPSLSRGLYGTTVFEDAAGDPAGRTILLGWVSGFRTGRGWRGCMSLPRVLSIREGVLIQRPLPELRQLRGDHVRRDDLVVASGTRRVDGVRGNALEIVAELDRGSAAACGLRLRCGSNGMGGLEIRWSDDGLLVAGTRIDANEPVLRRRHDGRLTLHLFLDRSVMELFINDGAATVTRVNYPDDEDRDVALFADDGEARAVSLDVWQLAAS